MSGDVEACCEHGLRWHHETRGCGYHGFSADQRCPCLLTFDEALAQHDAEQRAKAEREHSPGETCAEADERAEDNWLRAEAAEQRLAERRAAILTLAVELEDRHGPFPGGFCVDMPIHEVVSALRAVVSDSTALDRVRREAGADALDEAADAALLDRWSGWKWVAEAVHNWLRDRAAALRGGGE